MTRNHEKLLVAALAGIIIAGAAVFAIQPAMAQSFGVPSTSPSAVKVASSGPPRASPKSVNRGRPSASSRTFEGLMSR